MATLPIVDLERLLQQPTEDDYLAVAEDVRRVCEEHSFMYIVNHGIPSKTVTIFVEQKKISEPWFHDNCSEITLRFLD